MAKQCQTTYTCQSQGTMIKTRCAVGLICLWLEGLAFYKGDNNEVIIFMDILYDDESCFTYSCGTHHADWMDVLQALSN